MEFTLGFCGGVGMCYAISTSSWPDKGKASSRGNIAALLTIFLIIPLFNFFFAFGEEKLTRLANQLSISNLESFIATQQQWGYAFMVVFTLTACLIWTRQKNSSLLPLFGLLFSLYYLLFGFIVKGIFYQSFDLHNSSLAYPFILLLAVGLWWTNRNKDTRPFFRAEQSESIQQGLYILSGLLILILAISAISIHAHEGLGTYHERFWRKISLIW